jgi:predicted RNA binding protein YcfA (HicA-like mRNA interferase family)
VPSVDKIIEKMHNQPHGVRFEEANKVLTHCGYSFDRQNGSHRQYVAKSGDVLTIPAKSPLKKPYIDVILERIGK